MCDKFSQEKSLILHQLYDLIELRQQNLPPNSYTTTLFLGGIGKIVAKFSEESQELIEAATVSPTGRTAIDKSQVTHEAADLMYHFLVLLVARDVTLSDVEQELVRRFGVSGLTEKAARQ